MRTHFDLAERCALLRAARRFVEQTVRKQPHGTELEEALAGEDVSGLFTTLRRGGQLRACIGHWPLDTQQPLALGEALRQSASHAALHDGRFPSIHPDELDFLEVEVSVLSPPHPLPSCPEERLARVEPGRHGLILEWAGDRSVLLPQVASERGWDAETFLEQICAKCGAPAAAWKQPGAKLMVFEALHFSDAAARPEITLRMTASGVASSFGAALREPSPERLGGLERYPFEFWTGVSVESGAETDVWVLPSGNLRLLAESGLERVRGKPVRRDWRCISLLTHALPLSAADAGSRRHALGQALVYARTRQGRVSWRAVGERGLDPVPAVLSGVGGNSACWLAGEAEVLAFSAWPDRRGPG